MTMTQGHISLGVHFPEVFKKHFDLKNYPRCILSD